MIQCRFGGNHRKFNGNHITAVKLLKFNSSSQKNVNRLNFLIYDESNQPVTFYIKFNNDREHGGKKYVLLSRRQCLEGPLVSNNLKDTQEFLRAQGEKLVEGSPTILSVATGNASSIASATLCRGEGKYRVSSSSTESGPSEKLSLRDQNRGPGGGSA